MGEWVCECVCQWMNESLGGRVGGRVCLSVGLAEELIKCMTISRLWSACVLVCVGEGTVRVSGRGSVGGRWGCGVGCGGGGGWEWRGYMQGVHEGGGEVLGVGGTDMQGVHAGGKCRWRRGTWVGVIDMPGVA